MVKNPPANARDVRDAGSIPGWGRSPGGGHGNPLQYSCLENSMDRGAWRAMVHRVAKSQTQLKRLSTHVSSEVTSEFSCCFCSTVTVNWKHSCYFHTLGTHFPGFCPHKTLGVLVGML